MNTQETEIRHYKFPFVVHSHFKIYYFGQENIKNRREELELKSIVLQFQKSGKHITKKKKKKKNEKKRNRKRLQKEKSKQKKGKKI